MNKLITLILLASAFSIVANTPELNMEAIKKSNEENKKQTTLELNNAILSCLTRSQNYSTFIASYAEIAMKKNPEGDLLRDEVFAEILRRYYDLSDACRQKITAMAKINHIIDTKLVVNR